MYFLNDITIILYTSVCDLQNIIKKKKPSIRNAKLIIFYFLFNVLFTYINLNLSRTSHYGSGTSIRYLKNILYFGPSLYFITLSHSNSKSVFTSILLDRKFTDDLLQYVLF